MEERDDWDKICGSCFNEDACHWGGMIFSRTVFIGEPMHEFQKHCKDYMPQGTSLKPYFG